MKDKHGVVTTGGPSLRLRAKPNLEEDNVIEAMPNGAKVLIISSYRCWYKVETQSNIGYCLKKYISVK